MSAGRSTLTGAEKPMHVSIRRKGNIQGGCSNLAYWCSQPTIQPPLKTLRLLVRLLAKKLRIVGHLLSQTFIPTRCLICASANMQTYTSHYEPCMQARLCKKNTQPVLASTLPRDQTGDSQACKACPQPNAQQNKKTMVSGGSLAPPVADSGRFIFCNWFKPTKTMKCPLAASGPHWWSQPVCAAQPAVGVNSMYPFKTFQA